MSLRRTTVRNVGANGFTDVDCATRSTQATFRARICRFPAPRWASPAATWTKTCFHRNITWSAKAWPTAYHPTAVAASETDRPLVVSSF